MAEVLSQSQIDALLAAAMSGGQDLSQKEEKKYQKYDFRSPRKYTKERLKMLNGVFENYAKVLNTRINALARATCEVEVDTVDEQRYYEFSNALIDGEVVTLAYLNINGDIEETPVIIVATPSIMVSLIDRLMGGAGDVEEDLPSDYTYTDLDLSLYTNLMADFISIMGGSWENYLELKFDFGRIEANPTLVQLIGFEETVIMVSLDIKFSNSSGRLDICLPDAVLSKIFAEISKGNAVLRKEREDHSKEIYSHLQTSEDHGGAGADEAAAHRYLQPACRRCDRHEYEEGFRGQAADRRPGMVRRVHGHTRKVLSRQDPGCSGRAEDRVCGRTGRGSNAGGHIRRYAGGGRDDGRGRVHPGGYSGSRI